MTSAETPTARWWDGDAGPVDVHGTLFAYAGGRPQMWPAVLVELNLAVIDATTGREVADAIMAAGHGLSRCPQGLRGEPPQPEQVRWTVKLGDGPRRASGVYAPGVDGGASGWTVISPLPPVMAQFVPMVTARRGQCVVMITMRSSGLPYAEGDAFYAGVNACADAGDLWATRAAVLP